MCTCELIHTCPTSAVHHCCSRHIYWRRGRIDTHFRAHCAKKLDRHITGREPLSLARGMWPLRTLNHDGGGAIHTNRTHVHEKTPPFTSTLQTLHTPPLPLAAPVKPPLPLSVGTARQATTTASPTISSVCSRGARLSAFHQVMVCCCSRTGRRQRRLIGSALTRNKAT